MFDNYLLYLLVSLLLLFFVSSISYKLNLIDIPNKRKKHPLPTAYTGGLALSLIYVFSIFLFNVNIQELNFILSIGFLMGIVGLVDDKYNLNVGGKLSLQIIPIIYLIIHQELNLIQLGSYDYFKLELNSFSIPFTLISVLFLINSFNYFDGLDGSLSFSTISTLGFIFYLIDNEIIRLYLIIILIPLILFLFFNFSIFKVKKLFLGDGGSLLLGFIIAFTLIYLANKNLIHPILLAFSISIFVYEFLSINLIRLKNNKNPFRAEKDHLHDLLLIKTKSIFLTNFFLILSNFIFFIIGYLSFLFLSPFISLVLFILLFIIFFYLRIKYL